MSVVDQLRPEIGQQSHDEFPEEANSQPESSISTPNSNDQKLSDKQITKLNGEIGYFVKKATWFLPMTNFSVVCTGYVTENSESGSSEGFLFHVIPKTTLVNGDEDNPPEQRLAKGVDATKVTLKHIIAEQSGQNDK